MTQKFMIIARPGASQLESFVRMWLERGWKVQGGIAIDSSTCPAIFYQSLVYNDNDIIVRVP